MSTNNFTNGQMTGTSKFGAVQANTATTNALASDHPLSRLPYLVSGTSSPQQQEMDAKLGLYVPSNADERSKKLWNQFNSLMRMAYIEDVLHVPSVKNIQKSFMADSDPEEYIRQLYDYIQDKIEVKPVLMMLQNKEAIKRKLLNAIEILPYEQVPSFLRAVLENERMEEEMQGFLDSLDQEVAQLKDQLQNQPSTAEQAEIARLQAEIDKEMAELTPDERKLLDYMMLQDRVRGIQRNPLRATGLEGGFNKPISKEDIQKMLDQAELDKQEDALENALATTNNTSSPAPSIQNNISPSSQIPTPVSSSVVRTAPKPRSSAFTNRPVTSTPSVTTPPQPMRPNNAAAPTRPAFYPAPSRPPINQSISNTPTNARPPQSAFRPNPAIPRVQQPPQTLPPRPVTPAQTPTIPSKLEKTPSRQNKGLDQLLKQ